MNSRTFLERLTPLAIKMWSLKVKSGGIWWQVQLHYNVGPSIRNTYMILQNSLSFMAAVSRPDFTILIIHWTYFFQKWFRIPLYRVKELHKTHHNMLLGYTTKFAIHMIHVWFHKTRHNMLLGYTTNFAIHVWYMYANRTTHSSCWRYTWMPPYPHL